MGTVTYLNQPGIHATRGAVPLAGTKHLYRVKKRLWPSEVESKLGELIQEVGGVSLHVCAGYSRLGSYRLDIDPATGPDIVADAARIPVGDRGVATVLCDPPFNGRYRWMHGMLSELSRVAQDRIVFQHWFVPGDELGRYRKDWSFTLSELYLWQPRTYFGRAEVISVFDREG